MANRYIGYGLRIRSDISLPGFVEGEEGTQPTLKIACGSASSEEERIQLSDGGLNIAGFAAGVMRFRVRRGREIFVEPETGADLDYVRAIISGELMSVVLRQRGLLALHGSCVANDEGAIGFIGHSGWGKSTLSMHFVSQGYRLLCDDVLAIDLNGRVPVVIPGYPQVKMRKDVAEQYVREFSALPAAHTQTDKRLFSCSEEFQDQPVPLRKLYLLEGRKRSETKVLPLTSRQATMELVRHTRALKLLRHPEFSRAHLQQVGTLLKGVPISMLHRCWSLDSLPEVGTAVDQDLQQAPYSVTGS